MGTVREVHANVGTDRQRTTLTSPSGQLSPMGEEAAVLISNCSSKVQRIFRGPVYLRFLALRKQLPYLMPIRAVLAVPGLRYQSRLDDNMHHAKIFSRGDHTLEL